MESVKKTRRAGKLTRTLLIVAFCVGLALFLYPLVANYIYEQQQHEASIRYSQSLQQSPDVARMQEEVNEYNHALLDVESNRFAHAQESFKQLATTDVSTTREPPTILFRYNELLKVTDDGIVATVKIPKLHLTVAVYHGTSTEVLDKGAGHLEGSSLPSQEKNTHSVITAHTGVASKRLFTDLDQLAIGDLFSLETVFGTLNYKVDQIETVEPHDVSLLEICDDKNYSTLFTCTPYGLNSHRLMVRGVLVQDEVLDTHVATSILGSNWLKSYCEAAQLFGMIVVLAAIIAAAVFLQKRRSR